MVARTRNGEGGASGEERALTQGVLREREGQGTGWSLGREWGVGTKEGWPVARSDVVPFLVCQRVCPCPGAMFCRPLFLVSRGFGPCPGVT